MAGQQAEREMGSLWKRHEDQIRENAARIQEHIGYVMQRVSSGNAATVGLYAADIAAAAHRIVERVAVLEALAEAESISDAGAAH